MFSNATLFAYFMLLLGTFSCAHCKLEPSVSEVGNITVTQLKVNHFFVKDGGIFYDYQLYTDSNQLIRYDSLSFLVNFDRKVLSLRKEEPSLLNGKKGCENALDHDDVLDSVVVSTSQVYNSHFVKGYNLSSHFGVNTQAQLPGTTVHFFYSNITQAHNQLYFRLITAPHNVQKQVFLFKFYFRNKAVKAVQVMPVLIY